MFPIGRYLAFAGGIALALALAWGMRVNHLRAGYLSNLEGSLKVVQDAGYSKAKISTLQAHISAIVASRNSARTERDAAQQLIETQNTRISLLQKESEDAAREAEANRKLIAATIRERNAWISRAKDAETRTERLSAEQEVAECESVLDSLYTAGF